MANSGSDHRVGTSAEPRIRRVLVTGASGLIGALVCPALESRGFIVRAYDREPQGALRDWVEGDLEDRDALVNSAAGMDAILHLAACPDEADFVSALVPANIVGLYNVFEAARENGLRRFVLASSCRVAELSDSPGRIGVEARDPADMYGLTKLWAEEMGRMYSRLTSIHVVAARLGWVLRDTAELNEMQSMPRGPQLYLSHRDAAEFFCCCLEAPLPPYAVVYALSKQAHGELFDMRPARRLLGFEPRDTFPHGTTFAESD